MRSDDKLHVAIDDMIARNPHWPSAVPRRFSRSEWLAGKYGHLFLRMEWRILVDDDNITERNWTPTLTIANYSLPDKFQVQGIYTSLRYFLEAKGHIVYLENILDLNLARWMERYGYVQDFSQRMRPLHKDELPISMYRLPDSGE